MPTGQASRVIFADIVTARVVLILLLVLIVSGAYEVPTPWCLSGVENYVSPSQLDRGIILMFFTTLFFGPALAVFGPRWRLERLRTR